MKPLPIKLLLIDDHPEECRRLSQSISNSPDAAIETFAASSAECARLIHAGSRFDFVLLSSPVRQEDLTRTLKEIQAVSDPPIPILLLLDRNGKAFNTEALPEAIRNVFYKDQLGSDLFGRVLVQILKTSRMEEEFARQSRNQERFQKYHDLLQVIMEATTDVIFVKDDQGRYLILNSTAAGNFGMKPEEMIGKMNKDLNIPEESFRSMDESDRKVLQSGQTASYEVVLDGPKGSRTLYTTKSPFRDRRGKIAGLVGISRDVTNIKKSEEILRAEHAYRKPIEEAMLAGVVAMSNQTGQLIYINPAFCRIVGWSEQELLGQAPPFPFWPPEEKDNILKILKGRFLMEKPPEIELLFQRKNGERFPVLIKTAPLTDGKGNRIGIVSTLTDITNQKLSESRLRKSEARLAAVIDNSTSVIHMKDREGKFLLVNKRYEDLFRVTRLQMIGKTEFDFFPAEIAENLRNNDLEVIDRKCAIEFDEKVPQDDGELRHYLSVKFPLLDEEGEVYAVCGISTDITDRKNREEVAMKIEKLESLGLLAGGIAHDFNNILTAILGNISLSKTYVESDEKLLVRLNEAEKAALRASELAQQLLTFSKGGAPIKKIVSIRELIEHSVHFALTGSNIQCELCFQEGLWPVEADEGQMSQVIQNLIINAKQAMPSGGTIRVETKNLRIEEESGGEAGLRKGDYLAIAIEDQGTGIPREFLSKIFDPYFTTKSQGSGLGLSISHSIIKRHQGYITAETNSSGGSTFLIYLPASPSAVVRPENTREIMMRGKGKVLVMDDEASILSIAKEILLNLGYHAVAVKNGTEAVRLYREAKETGVPFQAVITDLTVPGDIGGIETLQRLREIDPDVKVIVSSGYSNDPAMADFKSFGFSDCLKKPYRAVDVGRIIGRVLGTRRLTD